MAKKLTYRHDKVSKTYSASNCLFAVQGYKEKNVQVFMDGRMEDILLMYTAMFQALINQSVEVACNTLEACMNLATKALEERDRLENLTDEIMDKMSDVTIELIPKKETAEIIEFPQNNKQGTD